MFRPVVVSKAVRRQCRADRIGIALHELDSPLACLCDPKVVSVTQWGYIASSWMAVMPNRNMSRTTAASSRRDRYTQEWLESSSSNLLSIDGQLVYDEDEQGLASQLYSLCKSVLRDLCSQEQGPPSKRSQSLLLKEELTKLYLWGQNFSPGELDTALGHADDARYIVLDALGNVGQSLLRGKISGTQEGYSPLRSYISSIRRS